MSSEPSTATISSDSKNISCETPNANNSNLKPCCACPDTRKLRDDCVFLHGEDNCVEFIEKHKECLRSYGFKV